MSPQTGGLRESSRAQQHDRPAHDEHQPERADRQRRRRRSRRAARARPAAARRPSTPAARIVNHVSVPSATHGGSTRDRLGLREPEPRHDGGERRGPRDDRQRVGERRARSSPPSPRRSVGSASPSPPPARTIRHAIHSSASAADELQLLGRGRARRGRARRAARRGRRPARRRARRRTRARSRGAGRRSARGRRWGRTRLPPRSRARARRARRSCGSVSARPCWSSAAGGTPRRGARRPRRSGRP